MIEKVQPVVSDEIVIYGKSESVSAKVISTESNKSGNLAKMVVKDFENNEIVLHYMHNRWVQEKNWYAYTEDSWRKGFVFLKEQESILRNEDNTLRFKEGVTEKRSSFEAVRIVIKKAKA